MKKTTFVLLTLITAMLTGLIGIRWVQLSSLPYNSEGNYFHYESAVVYHQQSVEIYALMTVILFALTGLCGYMTLKAFRK